MPNLSAEHHKVDLGCHYEWFSVIQGRQPILRVGLDTLDANEYAVTFFRDEVPYWISAVSGLVSYKARWWQVATQIFFLFSPRTLGKRSILTFAYFSKGLVQPPTRNWMNMTLAAEKSPASRRWYQVTPPARLMQEGRRGEPDRSVTFRWGRKLARISQA